MRQLASLFLILVCTTSFSQNKKIRSIEVSDSIISVKIDRPGDIYIITKDAQIQKFDKEGKLLVLYKHTPPTLFDPRDGARLFAYYRNQQMYEYLSPSFESVQAFQIDSAFVIEPWLIAPSNDNKLWMMDAADHTLKKLNPTKEAIEVEVAIDLGVVEDVKDIQSIREYQGFIFLHHPRKGILIFNSMGKYLRTLGNDAVRSFNFLGEEIYYIDKNVIMLYDLFTMEKRETPLYSPAVDVLLTDERRFEFSAKGFQVFEFRP